jgi:hypothetical protein
LEKTVHLVQLLQPGAVEVLTVVMVVLVAQVVVLVCSTLTLEVRMEQELVAQEILQVHHLLKVIMEETRVTVDNVALVAVAQVE